MIRELSFENAQAIYEVINQMARAYWGVIPQDCYHEPHMPKEELHREMKSMTFFGWEEEVTHDWNICYTPTNAPPLGVCPLFEGGSSNGTHNF